MHCVITTSTSSSSMFQAGLFSRVLLTIPVMLPWFSQSLVCLASQNSLFKPGYKQLFQTEAVTDDFSFSPHSLPRKSKTAAQERDGKERKEETSSASLTDCHSYRFFPSSSLFLSLLLKALEARIKMDRAFLQHWPRENSDLFRYTVQSIFPSIPFRFASDPVCSVPAVFPQVSNITETKKHSLLSSSSDTTSWNNPFLVNEKTTSIFEPDPMFNVLLPLF